MLAVGDLVLPVVDLVVVLAFGVVAVVIVAVAFDAVGMVAGVATMLTGESAIVAMVVGYDCRHDDYN